MRTVFNNAMLVHVFAQQTQAHGRGNNMSFAGDTLRSYGTPIARIVKARGGRKVLLLTSTSYSVTTSGHAHVVRHAFSGESFHVPSLGVSGGRDYGSRDDTHGKVNHKRNLAHLTKEYDAEKQRIRRAMSHYGFDHLRALAENVQKYSEAFGFKYRLDVDTDVAELTAFREAREARLNTPKAIAKRELARASREARNAERDRIKREQQAEAARVYRLSQVERIAEWRAGGNIYFGWDAQRMEDGSAMLRVKPGAPDTLQTSQGAEVPLSEARTLYKMLVRMGSMSFSTGAPGNESVKPMRVGHFTVDKITPEGVNIGCHYISRAEIDRFAQTQGW